MAPEAATAEERRVDALCVTIARAAQLVAVSLIETSSLPHLHRLSEMAERRVPGANKASAAIALPQDLLRTFATPDARP